MLFSRNFVACVLVLLAFATGAAAVPVQFTYTSNALDFSGGQEWKLTWLEDYGNYQYDKASFTIEVDCDIEAGVWSCPEVRDTTEYLGGYIATDRWWQDIRLIDIGTFWDTIYASLFKVDETGKVVEWRFAGSEGYRGFGAGDFTVSHTGDYYGWTYYIGSAAEAYCTYLHPNNYTDVMTCMQDPSLVVDYDPRIFINGTGTWTARVMGSDGKPLASTPLPAGLVLMLSGVGCIVGLRRRRIKRSPRQPTV